MGRILRSLTLSFLILSYSIIGNAQTLTSSACPSLMDQVCTEHCGNVKSYRIGDWSGSETLVKYPVLSTDPDQLVYQPPLQAIGR